MLFRITAMAVVMEWASVQAAHTTTTVVMVIMETVDLVTIRTVHITPMVVDMVTTLMDMEWVV